MKVTRLARAAAVAAMAAGVLFMGIQFIHPTDQLASVATGRWVVTGYLTMVMAILALVGVVGVYLRQADESGIPGLLGFVFLGLFFLLTTAFGFAETLILPVVASEAPGFVENFLGLFNGDGTDGSLGTLEAVPAVAGALYMTGGVLFGLGIFRARVLDRRAGLLLAGGAVLPVLTDLVSHGMARLFALPVGLALVFLGLSLWFSLNRPSLNRRPGEHQNARAGSRVGGVN